MNQTTIFDAIAQQEQAFKRIEKADPGAVWRSAAFAFVKLYARQNPHGMEFTGEDVVDEYARRGLIPPDDQRWWGPVLKKAGKEGVIVALDGRSAPRRKGHGTSGAKVYVSGSGA